MMSEVGLVCATDKDQKPNNEDVQDNNIYKSSEGVDLNSIKLDGVYVHISGHKCVHNKQITRFPDQVEKHQSNQQGNTVFM